MPPDPPVGAAFAASAQPATSQWAPGWCEDRRLHQSRFRKGGSYQSPGPQNPAKRVGGRPSSHKKLRDRCARSLQDFPDTYRAMDPYSRSHMVSLAPSEWVCHAPPRQQYVYLTLPTYRHSPVDASAITPRDFPFARNLPGANGDGQKKYSQQRAGLHFAKNTMAISRAPLASVGCLLAYGDRPPYASWYAAFGRRARDEPRKKHCVDTRPHSGNTNEGEHKERFVKIQNCHSVDKKETGHACPKNCKH
jgi:hypothetical protein